MDAEESSFSNDSGRLRILDFSFRQSPQPMIICDSMLMIHAMNPAAAALFSVSDIPFEGRKIAETLPALTSGAQALIQQCLEKQTTRNHLDLELQLHDGSCRRLQIAAMRIPHPKAHLPLFQFYLSDASHFPSSHALEELKKSDQMMDQISASMPVVLYMFDLQRGQNQYLNNQFERILGWNHEKHGPITMDYFSENLHPDDARKFPNWAARWNDAKDGEVHETRYRLRDTSGRYHWFQTYDTVFSRSEDGRVKEIIGSAIEITELQEARIALENERGRLEAIASQAPIVVLECDEDGIIQYLNRPQLQFGLKQSDVIGHSLFDYVEEGHHLQLRDSMDRAISGEQDVQVEIQTRVGNKNQWALLNIAPIVHGNSQNAERHLIIVGQEISTRKQMEMRLEELSLRAETASRSKTEFFVGLSHDIRTPMNSIMGIADLLLDTDLNANQRKMAEILRDSSDALAGLLERTLQLSRVEMGLMGPLAKTDFSIAGAIRKTLSLFHSDAESRNLSLESHIAAELPSLVRSSESAFLQLLVNLVGNAVRYTEAGTIEVNLEKARRLPAKLNGSEKDFLIAEITDTGPGIPADELPHVFEMFYQGSRARNNSSSSGIGLSGCKRLIDAVDGDIEIISPVPQKKAGTKVRFYFPYTEAEAPGEAAESDDQPFRAGRVLLVEDNTLNQFVAARMLENAGLVHSLAVDIAQAMQLLQKESFDLVLLDLGLPDGDGRTVARWMRSRKIQTPIIAVTAAAFEEEKQSALQAGMNDFLAKPIDQRSLRRMLEKHLSHLR
ncbi:MAG: hypothetical protein CMF59_10730 [Leptospiraceae bacterium]|nr:hypothetical protein [Leptospiraceae bacterium]